ncbi:conjugal transfer protein TrbJ [Cupriavidus sp. IK-TO18]|uniref:conjugal transfer protein TrbJ n=1 Tax=Cupriavidus sp. IK-TO18 TaxID=2782182 RepID=UPI0018991F38|nr:conjugal transfer protein TrbJ [Cupriavidus sp. IK-TO18]MBF6989399.1 conjugal transfer protein TrbJ [Cupriavidus sp. IK-TO18]
MKKWIANIAIATSVFGASSAHAALPVTDWVGLIQTTMTAMQSLKTEVYENTNIAYQYKMMANQLLQSTGLDAAALTEQLDAIRDDISKYEVYGTSLKDLYGTVSDNADYLKKIQSMVVASGKTKEQWFQDQRQLLSNGDKTAKNLFSLGEQIFKNTQSVAQRRQKIQAQVKLSPTAQAAAQSTNQMLDVLASQNSDLLQLMSVRAQADADKDQQSVARETQSAEAMRAITTAQDEELRQLRARVFSRKLQAD